MSSKTSKKNLVSIGKITGVHGLDGNVKVFSHSGFSSTYTPERRLIVKKDDEDRANNYIIDWARPYKKGILLKFKGLDRSAAEAIVGAGLYIERSALPDLEADTYYWFELIGLDVYSPAQEHIGVVTSIIPTGSNDVYVVRKGAEEILIPAIASVIQDIDPEKGTMIVCLPEGL